ncbi:MAG: SIS domain-containing protein [Candidatus Limnocylindrales bacterium]
MSELRSNPGGFNPEAPLPAAPDPWQPLPMPQLRDAPPWAMAEMISAEPALVARVGQRLLEDGSAAALAALIRDVIGRGETVVVTGCGTSDYAGRGAAAILREACAAAGLPAPGPQSAGAFELSCDPPSGLVIGVSHEGGTAATIDALDAARQRGARTALITGSANSPAAKGCDVVLATVEMDRSWCHTVGYVSPLAAACVTAGLIAGHTPDPQRLRRRLAMGLEAARGHHGAMGNAAARAKQLLVIATGADRITARELSLKVEEAAWLPTTARALETFLHGHLPATGPDTALVLLLLERGAIERRAARARQALAAAAVVGIRPGAILGEQAAALIPDTLTPAGRIVVPDMPELPNEAAALLGAAAPLQLLTLAIAAARGTNPDPIRRDDPRYLRAADVADAPF